MEVLSLPGNNRDISGEETNFDDSTEDTGPETGTQLRTGPLGSSGVNDGGSESGGPPETPGTGSYSDQSLNESHCSGGDGPRTPTCEGRGGVLKDREETMSGASDVLHGEQLLQRLLLLQRRQEAEERTEVEFHTEVRGLTSGGRSLTEDDVKGLTFHVVTMDRTKVDLVEGENENVSKPPSAMWTREEEEEEEEPDRWTSEDLVLLSPHGTSNSPRLYDQYPEVQEAKNNLQRTRAVVNLADDPDVLEIPFKTKVSLDPHPGLVGPDRGGEPRFSEQKMQKEISQEIQRELVLINQGSIPGVYSKGQTLQLKEAKLLFESFQQGATRGPTRLRKLPPALIHGHVYPSVLERTRSLEMCSVQGCPVDRVPPPRLSEPPASETVESPGDLSSGGSRDRTRLSPYPKQDKHPRLHRSMECITNSDSTAPPEARGRTTATTGQASPPPQQNPFFKLRPALALQPQVEKDIRQAREREEELHRQRSEVYGETQEKSQEGEEEEESQTTGTHGAGTTETGPRSEPEHGSQQPKTANIISRCHTLKEPTEGVVTAASAAVMKRLSAGVSFLSKGRLLEHKSDILSCTRGPQALV